MLPDFIAGYYFSLSFFEMSQDRFGTYLLKKLIQFLIQFIKMKRGTIIIFL